MEEEIDDTYARVTPMLLGNAVSVVTRCVLALIHPQLDDWHPQTEVRKRRTN